MGNLMVRVIMGVGVIAASFVAGHHSASPHSGLSGVAMTTSAANHSTGQSQSTANGQNTMNAETATNLQNTANVQNASVDNSKEPAYKITLSKQIRLVNTAALTAIGGGKVLSVTPTSWHNTAAWDVRIAQPSGQYDVIVSKAQHNILAQKPV